MKKTLLAILMATLTLSIICFAGCGQSSDDDANIDSQIFGVYSMYKAYAEEKGEKSLSYEEWLASIKGMDGVTPTVEISKDGYWIINGMNTGFNAIGQNGTTPTIDVNADGYWVINGVPTNYRAIAEKGSQGEKGEKGEKGETPTIEIDNDGYWVINGVKTQYKATGNDGKDGEKGQDGKDGTTPTIEISEDGYWVINNEKTNYKAVASSGSSSTIEIDSEGYWVINGVKTQYKAIGEKGNDGANGANGQDGKTPKLRINGENNEWEVSYDDGATWTTLGVKATGNDGANGVNGVNGQDGKDGTTPTIEISEDGYWIINGTKTEHKAIGEKGEKGDKGDSGEGGSSATHTHTLSDWIVDTKPSCGKIGLKHKECTDCKAILEISLINELTHEYENYVCKHCGAEDYTESLQFKMLQDKTGYEVVGIEDATITEVYIPSKYKGLPVTIGTKAFYYNEVIEKVYIHNGVTSIGNSAFYYCSKLTSINIPNSVTSIGTNAFCNCSSLTSVTIGNGVTSIGGSAFEYCSSLESVYYTGTIDRWVQISFSSGTSNPLCYAKNLYINNTLITEANITTATKINDYAFNGFRSLTSITIPDSVTSIGEWAFNYCTSLESIKIGNSVASIGEYAFRNCSNLTSVTIGNSVTSIGNYAFYSCSSLTSITIPDSVISIGNDAFYSCSNLTSVTIGNSVTSIGGSAFKNCSSLTSVTIPDSVTSIDYSAFSGCSSLTYNEYDNAYYLGNDSNPYVALMKVKSKDITSCTINENCKVIYNSAFLGCSSLTSVTIGNSVTSIARSAFNGCSSLTSVIIPDSVTSIDSFAFNGCSSLTSVIIPDSVTSIDSFAFEYCSSLTSATIGNSVTSIDYSTFSSCSSLTSVTIGNSVTSIGDSAFKNCSSLTSVTIPNSVTSIGKSAFSGCSSLTSVTIPNSVTSIGSSAFSGCSSLISITIPSSVTSIGSSAFADCYNLTTVTFDGDGTENQTENISLYYDSSIIVPSEPSYSRFENCYKLVEIVNKRNFDESYFESSGCNPLIIHSGESKIVNKNGFLFITIDEGEYNDGNYLVNYVADNDSTSEEPTQITLPEDFDGESYIINSYAFAFCGFDYGYLYFGDPLVIPEKVTSIRNCAFSGCNIYNIVLPSDIESVYNFFGEIDSFKIEIYKIFTKSEHFITVPGLEGVPTYRYSEGPTEEFGRWWYTDSGEIVHTAYMIV